MRLHVSGKSRRAFKGGKGDIYGSIISQSISDILGRLRKYLLMYPLLPNLPLFSFRDKVQAINIIKILEGFGVPELGARRAGRSGGWGDPALWETPRACEGAGSRLQQQIVWLQKSTKIVVEKEKLSVWNKLPLWIKKKKKALDISACCSYGRQRLPSDRALRCSSAQRDAK